MLFKKDIMYLLLLMKSINFIGLQRLKCNIQNWRKFQTIRLAKRCILAYSQKHKNELKLYAFTP